MSKKRRRRTPIVDEEYKRIANSNETEKLPRDRWPTFLCDEMPDVVEVLSFGGPDFQSSHALGATGQVTSRRSTGQTDRFYYGKDENGQAFRWGPYKHIRDELEGGV